MNSNLEISKKKFQTLTDTFSARQKIALELFVFLDMQVKQHNDRGRVSLSTFLLLGKQCYLEPDNFS